MTTKRRTRPRRSSRARPLTRVLVVALTVVVGAVYLAFGGVVHEGRAVGHLGLALVLLGALGLPADALGERSGAAVRYLVAGAALIGALGLGLMPLPSALGGIVSPAWARDRGAVGWDWSSLDPIATVTALSGTWLVWGGAVAGALLGGGNRGRALENAVMVATAAFLGVALLHLATGSMALFGVYSVAYVGSGYFAPFVNTNHFGAALLVGFPVFLVRALSSRGSEQLAAAVGAIAVVAAAVAAGSLGPLVVLALQALAVGVARGFVWRSVALAVVVAAAAAFVPVALWVGGDGPRALITLNGRLWLWASSVVVVFEHWLLGTGAGAFNAAVEPRRWDSELESWIHAHNEWLQWLVETGLVGGLALVVALVLVWPRPRRSGRGVGVTIGLLGLLGHGLVDFPLRIVGIGLFAAVVAGARAAAFDALPAVRPLWVRLGLVALALGHGAGAAWEARTAAVAQARRALAADDRDADALGWLARLEPSAWELGVERARQAYASGDRDEARRQFESIVDEHGRNPRALRAAGLALAGFGDPAASRAMDRAVERAPFDRRNWLARADVVSRVQPDRTLEVWAEAVRRVPEALKQGWQVAPIAVFWVDALEGEPATTQLRLGRFLLQQDELDGALLCYASLRLQEPDRYPADLAEVLVRLGREEEAVAYLEEAIAAGHAGPGVVDRLASAHAASGRWDEALRLLLSLEEPSSAQRSRLIQASWRAEGAPAALARIRAWETTGEPVEPSMRALQARMEAESGNPAGCREVVGRWFGRPTSKKVEKMLEDCGKPSGSGATP